MLKGLVTTRGRRYNEHFDSLGEKLKDICILLRKSFNDDEAGLKQTLQLLSEENASMNTIITSLRNDIGNTLFSPLDREDIHFLTSDLRLVSGGALHIAGHKKNLGQARLPTSMPAIISLMTEAMTELSKIVSMIKHTSQLKNLAALCRSVKQVLYKCDVMLDDATAEVLHAGKDTYELIKMTDLFSAMQRLLEKMGDVVDNSEMIIIKYS